MKEINDTYEPICKNCELGHYMFYKSNIRAYSCPNYIVALLRDINKELCRVMWNINQEEYDSPFDNNGNIKGFSNDIFEVHAFDWNEDHDQRFNFRYKNIKISWYKYLGRDVTINCQINEKDAIDMYNDCIESLRKLEDFYNF